MIFYFSGTGNSLYAAKTIADFHREKLVSIAEEMNKEEFHEYTLGEHEVIGFVFPVYAWAPPKMVLQFIETLKLKNYKNNYTFSVATCGDNIGNTKEVLKAALKKRGMSLDSGFSISMPNNYIIGFDVDSKELEQVKLIEAQKMLASINERVRERRKGVFDVVKGPVPWILTSVINPLFNKKGINTKRFYAKDDCTGCGLCAEICNCKNIKVVGKPKWGTKCSQCLACLHLCPVRAIQYGKGTEKKGRYKNPYV